jgi:mono/diheme cytochrome c family protein
MRLPLILFAVATAIAAAGIRSASAQDVEFNRDVRPILSDHCFQCHGPDAKNRQAELRLDREEDAFAKRDKPAIIRGKPAESELVRRITSTDADERMPPADANKPLSPQQIDILKRWVEQGAQWQKHWSLIRPIRPALPELFLAGGKPAFGTDAAPPQNAIDLFIRTALAKHGLAPSPAAAKHSLLRRASFDLTGLPPTLDQLDLFEADETPDAYERAVDRLLASPRYGERMAIRWLEAARYADTHGYQSDGERQMWRWRDWVIEAFNHNMPFDQFTIEQLAGDLLPNATLDQKIATAFNRNHRGNSEGGIIPEEYAVEYVVDRVETTSTVWLGLTMGCVRCHDHKFDPFTMKDFYSLFAFFNNVPEKGRAIKFGNSPPYIPAPTRLQAERSRELLQKYNDALKERDRHQERFLALFEKWQREYEPRGDEDVQRPTRGLVARFDFDDKEAAFTAGASRPPRLIAKDGDVAFVPGQRGSALSFEGKVVVEAGDLGDFGLFDPFSLSAWVWIDEGGGGTIVSKMTDVHQGDGYQLAIVDGKVQLNIVKRWLDDALRLEAERPITPGKWHHVAAIFEGFAGDQLELRVHFSIDGELEAGKALQAELNQPFNVKEPLRIGGGGGPEMRFRGKIDDVRIFSVALDSPDIEMLATAENVAEILRLPKEERKSCGRHSKLSYYFLDHHAPAEMRRNEERLEEAALASIAFDSKIPTVMVMKETSPPRKTHMLKRGQYDQPGDEVQPDVPSALSSIDRSMPINRLGLAIWLLEPANPLTGRVTVNRVWQQFFGRGIVKTIEDFGSQGEWPTHPELLDWLAVEFRQGSGGGSQESGQRGQETRDRGQDAATLQSAIRNPQSGWDLKRLARLIVTSATYRQSSAVTPEALQKDPDNRWLSRAPRQRLSAEMVRDQALAVSGLLVEELGGPSVKPYQPPGLWSELTGADDYVQDHGENLYRRSLYTYWKRTIAPPTMLTFDAATREFCTVRETRTNTPLQALTLLNETGFVETSRKLAERALHEGGASDAQRLAWLFRTVISRRPSAEEQAVLQQGLTRHREHFAADSAAAKAVLSTGESPADERFAAEELAAYTAIAGLVLNLDEAINKE